MDFGQLINSFQTKERITYLINYCTIGYKHTIWKLSKLTFV